MGSILTHWVENLAKGVQVERIEGSNNGVSIVGNLFNSPLNKLLNFLKIGIYIALLPDFYLENGYTEKYMIYLERANATPGGSLFPEMLELQKCYYLTHS